MLFCVLDEDDVLCFYIQQIQGCKIIFVLPIACFSCLLFLLESLQILQ